MSLSCQLKLHLPPCFLHSLCIVRYRRFMTSQDIIIIIIIIILIIMSLCTSSVEGTFSQYGSFDISFP